MDITINEIANLSLKKLPKKKDAFTYVLGVIEKLQENEFEDAKDAIANLYGIFSPNDTPTKEAMKNPEVWVRQALETHKNAQPGNKYIYAYNGVIYATDKYRIHSCLTHKENGFYDKAGIRIDIDYQFPTARVESYFNKEKYPVQIWESLETILETEEVSSGQKTEKYKTIRIKIGNSYYPSRHIKQALKPKGGIFQASSTEKEQVIFIDNADGTKAIISPLINQ